MENLLTKINLREHLEYGDLNKIIEKTGATRNQINWVLDGKGFNEKIINAITEVVAEKKAIKKRAFSRLQKAIS